MSMGYGTCPFTGAPCMKHACEVYSSTLQGAPEGCSIFVAAFVLSQLLEAQK
jgi:hypothetical protein